MYFSLLHDVTAEPADLASLAVCVSGGAPMPPPVASAFRDRYGIDVLEGYGLSETSPVVCFDVPGRPSRPGSVGFPIPGVELRLVDEAGQVVEGHDRPGELWVRGDNVMKGYYRDPEATAEALREGWLRTGDVAARDGDGAYRILERKKDLILRGGYNVYPREVEAVLHAHPAVAEAAVVGVPDERYGEEVVAFVTLADGGAVTEAELAAHCRERLAHYKYPRRVVVVEELPHTPTGKVLKPALRRLAAAGATAA